MIGERRVSSRKARSLILAGNAPADLQVDGHLDFANELGLTKLPDGLRAASLNLTGCVHLRELPERLVVSVLRLDGCTLSRLPADLSCQVLEYRNGLLAEIPAGLKVAHHLNLEGCSRLLSIPDGLSTQRLTLRGCWSLRELPRSFAVDDLDISRCSAFAHWPAPCSMRLARLNVAECSKLAALPEGLRIDEALELANSGLADIPESLDGVPLHWRGVEVSWQIAFRPETLKGEEILTHPNAEVRRIMVERLGFERVLRECQPTELDRDRDPGGERSLLKVPMRWDEDLVCLSVLCPSTARQYILRVPPHMRTCRQAAAWLAGFDNPDDYHPQVET